MEKVKCSSQQNEGGRGLECMENSREQQSKGGAHASQGERPTTMEGKIKSNQKLKAISKACGRRERVGAKGERAVTWSSTDKSRRPREQVAALPG